MSHDCYVGVKVLIIFIISVTCYMLYSSYNKIHFFSNDKKDYLLKLYPKPPSWINQYGDIYEFLSQKKYTQMENFYHQKKACPPFYSNFADNVMYVLTNGVNFTANVSCTLQLDEKSAVIKPMNFSRRPVILAAFSANHFREAEGLIKGIHENIKSNSYNLSLLVYDIGLLKDQLQMLKQYCRCTVRKFPFEKFPLHVRDLHTYTWKPILIQLVLQEYDFVMWMDTSIRLTNASLAPLFEAALARGIQIRRGGGSLAVRTHKDTFRILKENPCRFLHFPETPTGWMLFVRNHFTMTAVMKPWVSCALSPGCMSPPNYANFTKCFPKRHYVGSCHRFDQSVLGIILTRIFNRNRSVIHFIHKNKFGVIKRQDAPLYFPRKWLIHSGHDNVTIYSSYIPSTNENFNKIYHNFA